MVTRLAPEYAVCRRVLEEALRLLSSGTVLPRSTPLKWRPREALVYGAGVGAPVIALLEVGCSWHLHAQVQIRMRTLPSDINVRPSMARGLTGSMALFNLVFRLLLVPIVAHTPVVFWAYVE